MLAFVPIPRGHLNATSEHWLPFIPKIAKRSKEPIKRLLEQISSFEVRIALVWDDAAQAARALVGIQLHRRGDDLIGEIKWLTGHGMTEWVHLLPEMERVLWELGCAEIRPICRPGWARLLKANGYKVTHYVMEKKHG